MYSAVAPPSALLDGVTVHKAEDVEVSSKGRLTQASLARIQQARAKNQVLSRQLNKEVTKIEAKKAAGVKRKEQDQEQKKKAEDKAAKENKEKEEPTPEKHPLEMMKHYLNPNPQLRGVPEGALAVKSELEEDIDKAIRDGDYDKAEALNKQLAEHKQASTLLTSIECVKYSVSQRKEEQLTREKKKPRLNWTFDPKQNWERKGNM